MMAKRGNTNFAKASYTEIYDIQTNSDRPTVMGFHSPTSTMPFVTLNGFFTQFLRYKYTGCDVTLVPASTLPADPLQLSYESGETTIDPRDMLNPILFKGCCGVDLPTALRRVIPSGQTTSSYSGAVGTETDSSSNGMQSIDIFSPADDSTTTTSGYTSGKFEALYYQLLTDPTWKKSSIQSGAKLHLYPLVQKLIGQGEIGPMSLPTTTATVTSTPTYINGAQVKGLDGGYITEVSSANSTGGMLLDEDGDYIPRTMVGMTVTDSEDVTSFQTFPIFSNGWTKLGWLPTQPFINNTYLYTNAVNALPRIMMGAMFMPPAYKTEFYFRVVVRHKFLFKGYSPTFNRIPYGSYTDNNVPHVTQYYSSSSTASTTSSVDLYDSETDSAAAESDTISLIGEYASSD